MLQGAAAAAVASAGGIAIPGRAYADYSITIDPAPSLRYTWDGWGAALSWWATVFGMNDTLADLFYTRNTVSLLGRSLPGLGLNIVRYNLGACTWNSVPGTPEPVKMYQSPNIVRRKQIEGYWLNWDSTDPASASWNWSADSNQRNMMWKARDRGADLFEMFSVSPIWWMCNNYDPSGSGDGLDNLQTWNRQQHARYVAIVAKYAHDNWGVNFTSVDPFNEPTFNWMWNGNQEGCHFENGTQEAVIGYLRSELDARGLSSMKIAASDEQKYSHATATWNGFPSTVRSQVGRVNVHGYEYSNDPAARSQLRAALGTKPVWQTEYSEGYDHGLYMAYNLSIDLRFLRPQAWCYWQAVDTVAPAEEGAPPTTWGLIHGDYDDPSGLTGQLVGVPNKYFVFAHYTRHIRRSMQILDSGDQATVAAYDANARRLVLVTVRGDTTQRVTYDLSKFTTVGGASGGTVRRWTTDVNPDAVDRRQYVRESDVRLNGKSLAVDHQLYTVTTLEIDNVVP